MNIPKIKLFQKLSDLHDNEELKILGLYIPYLIGFSIDCDNNDLKNNFPNKKIYNKLAIPDSMVSSFYHERFHFIQFATTTEGYNALYFMKVLCNFPFKIMGIQKKIYDNEKYIIPFIHWIEMNAENEFVLESNISKELINILNLI